MATNKLKKGIAERPPVVAVMGHVDHGKSTLLDYIRKTNIVDGEAGGITQHISAYEVEYNYEGNNKKITFLDTPGHAAFSHMRSRGAAVADIAILIISAEDSVKPQTKEAAEIIKKHKIPFIVAINKIDKPNANPEKIKADLLELGIYVEGYGGDVPFALISSQTGEGIPELLDTICLIADLEEMTGDLEKPATGFVIESHRDPKQGISATLVIKDGAIKRGDYVVAHDVMAPTRMLKDFTGKNIDKAQLSSPIQIIGFDDIPYVGKTFETYPNKKSADQAVSECEKDIECNLHAAMPEDKSETAIIPIIIKSDVLGTGQAIAEEIEKLNDQSIFFKILKQKTGEINQSDIQLALSDENSIILGFNVKVANNVKKMQDFDSVKIKTYNIIYKLTEWLEEEKENIRFKKDVEVIQGEAKIIKIFSWDKKGHGVVGAKVETGTLATGNIIKIVRRNEEIGKGKISEIQHAKQKVSSISGAKTEFGMMVDSKLELAPGDILQTYILEEQ